MTLLFKDTKLEIIDEMLPIFLMSLFLTLPLIIMSCQIYMAYLYWT